VVLVALDVSVPFWAEHTGGTSWHPHHIAERYGLFTIILLGESIAALAGGIEPIIRASGPTGTLVSVGVSSLVLVFALWWLYFMQPAGEGLALHRDRSFLWGYGHYAVFAALAGLGGGLEVVVAFAGGHSHISPVVAVYAVAVPVAVYLTFLWAVHAPILARVVIPLPLVAPAAAAVLLLPLAADAIGLPVTFGLVVLVVVATVALVVVRKDRGLRTLAARPEAG
jgi:low temperature requirement protein LtrA